ncbi:NAD(P)H-dependent oxidoreductase [Actinomadura sp. ATCC 31491]|uniref:NAD(P)H-dependent oxidoreductase n=1 Tax=Actinomadura luzonensis TaxID=2805427 RepID=A0ABT0G2S6_9ACTN|nr:NAD(P)H-dependent oxidoreductase [Actinomadura luzonensis]MCK2218899.1 NAD(P)H-dependent oxidoreductase [Actinomadura luzonensis]
MKIIGIAAGLHAGSFVNRLLGAAGGELPEGVGFEVWSGLRQMPPYEDGPVPATAPAPVRELAALVAAADAVIVTAPEHSLLPDELIDTLDWLTARGALAGKHVAVMSASARACGAMWAQAELYKRLQTAGAVVTGAELVILPGCRHFEEDGRLADPVLREQVRGVIGRLCPAELLEPAAAVELLEPAAELLAPAAVELLEPASAEALEPVLADVLEPALMPMREPGLNVREPALSR